MRLQWLMVSISLSFLGALVFLPATSDRVGTQTQAATRLAACVGDEQCPEREETRRTDEPSSAQR